MSFINNTEYPYVELAIVMPIYNEEACIVSVIESWINIIKGLSIPAVIIAINDGSKDGTKEQLQQFDTNPGIIVINKKNEGHGPTIMRGYRKAIDMADWIFQIDSDGELDADNFEKFWLERQNFDLLFGIRQGRDQAFGRAVISGMSRVLVRVLCGKGITDVNVPYRLMRKDILKNIIIQIPDSTFAPNVAIAGLAVKSHCRINNIPVEHHPRQTGCCSLVKWNLIKSAIKSFMQTIIILTKGK